MYQVQGTTPLPEGNIDLGNQYARDRTKWQRPQLMVWADNEGVFGDSGSVQGNTYPWGREGENFIITSDHNRSALSVDQLRLENRMRMVGGNMRSYYTGQKVTLNCSWNLLPSRAYQREVFVGEKTTPYSQWPYGQPKTEDAQDVFSNPPVTVTLTNINNTHATFSVSTSEQGIQAVQIKKSGFVDNLFECGLMGTEACNLSSGKLNYVYERQQGETEVSFVFDVGVGSLLGGSTNYQVVATIDFNNVVTNWLNSMPTSEFTADGGAGGADLLQWYRNTHGPFWVYLSYDNYPNFEGNTDVWNQFNKYSDRYMMYFTSFNYSVEKRGLYDMWNVSVSLEEA